MKAEAVLINLPQRQHPVRRVLFTTATLVAWVIWASLWLPLITLLAWLVGVDVGYRQLILKEHGHGAHDLLFMLGIAALCALVFVVWSFYNRLRYGRLRRRRVTRSVDHASMAGVLGVQVATARHMRHARRVVLEFPEGEPVRHRQPAYRGNQDASRAPLRVVREG